MDPTLPSPPSTTPSETDTKALLSQAQQAQQALTDKRQQTGLRIADLNRPPASSLKTSLPNSFEPGRHKLYEAIQESQEAREREQRTQSILTTSGLPARHLGREVDAEAYPLWMSARDKAMAAALAGFSLLLCGPRGTGKTQIAIELGRAFAARQKSVQYAKASQLFRELRQAMHQYREVEAIDLVCRKGLLILDEAHVRGETDYEDRTLIEIFDRRYDFARPTVLITNLSLAESKKALGSSIVDRCVESGQAIVCDWPSFRPLVREPLP
jgi:DNA replication protein DnaC